MISISHLATPSFTFYIVFEQHLLWTSLKCLCYSGLRTVWPDESMGPFGRQDPSPANVDFECHHEELTEHQMKSPADKMVPDTLSTYTESHKLFLRQFIGDLFVSVKLNVCF